MVRKHHLILSFLLLWAAVCHSQGMLAGADLSYVPRLEYSGVEYTIDGSHADILPLFHDAGYSIIRLRLWHTPNDPWHGIDSTIAFARRVTNAGFEIMLDIHFSDTWADPEHQAKPSAWQDLELGLLTDSVYQYTNSVIRRFQQADALPSIVQIGNEIRPGFLWNEGRVGWDGSEWDTPDQWTQFTTLLTAASNAVTDSLPDHLQPDIMLHVHDGGDNTGSRWFFDHIEEYSVPYDLIGLSYYPWWHGELSALETNLDDLATRYNKPVWIVETAFPWTFDYNDDTNNFVYNQGQLPAGYSATPGDQKRFFDELEELVASIPDGRGGGICLWEPAWVVSDDLGCPWENLAVFDFENNALPALSWYSSVYPEADAISPQPYTPILATLSPNPFNSVLRLNFQAIPSTAYSISVYNLLGQRIVVKDGRSVFTGSVRHDLDFSGLPSGLYIVRVTETGTGRSESYRAVYLP